MSPVDLPHGANLWIATIWCLNNSVYSIAYTVSGFFNACDVTISGLSLQCVGEIFPLV